MNRIINILLLCALCTLLCSPLYGRIWTSSNNKYRIEGNFYSLENNGTSVKIRKTDGNIISVSIDKLSKSDQEYIKTCNKPSITSDTHNNQEPSNSASRTYRKAGDRMVKTINGVEFVFRWCPSGKLKLLPPDNNDIIKRSKDQDLYTISMPEGFWIMETEVSQKQWKAIMNYNVCPFKGDTLPMTCSWVLAMDFCQRCNEIGLPISLPTITQWCYACYAGQKNIRADKINEMAWDLNNSGRSLHPVGIKMSNKWGIYDMLGNVSEWCLSVNNKSENDFDTISSSKDDDYIALGGNYLSTALNKQSDIPVLAGDSTTMYPQAGFRCIISSSKSSSKNIETYLNNLESDKIGNVNKILYFYQIVLVNCTEKEIEQFEEDEKYSDTVQEFKSHLKDNLTIDDIVNYVVAYNFVVNHIKKAEEIHSYIPSSNNMNNVFGMMEAIAPNALEQFTSTEWFTFWLNATSYSEDMKQICELSSAAAAGAKSVGCDEKIASITGVITGTNIYNMFHNINHLPEEKARVIAFQFAHLTGKSMGAPLISVFATLVAKVTSLEQKDIDKINDKTIKDIVIKIKKRNFFETDEYNFLHKHLSDVLVAVGITEQDLRKMKNQPLVGYDGVYVLQLTHSIRILDLTEQIDDEQD